MPQIRWSNNADSKSIVQSKWSIIQYQTFIEKAMTQSQLFQKSRTKKNIGDNCPRLSVNMVTIFLNIIIWWLLKTSKSHKVKQNSWREDSSVHENPFEGLKIHLRNKITRGKSQVKTKEEESGRQKGLLQVCQRLLILCFADGSI